MIDEKGLTGTAKDIKNFKILPVVTCFFCGDDITGDAHKTLCKGIVVPSVMSSEEIISFNNKVDLERHAEWLKIRWTRVK